MHKTTCDIFFMHASKLYSILSSLQSILYTVYTSVFVFVCCTRRFVPSSTKAFFFCCFRPTVFFFCFVACCPAAGVAKFNLFGLDLSARQYAAMLGFGTSAVSS